MVDNYQIVYKTDEELTPYVVIIGCYNRVDALSKLNKRLNYPTGLKIMKMRNLSARDRNLRKIKEMFQHVIEG